VKKILLVDDDRRFVETAARELMLRGFRVEEAADGLEAIEKALEEAPDLAVVDLIMPRVGGTQLVAFFRQNAYLTGVPIVVLSGVVAESLGTVEALDVELVLAKGPREDTARRLSAAVERLLREGRGAKEIACLPGAAERRQVVELLQVTRDLNAVLDGAAAGILELDPRGRVAFANRRADELLGLAPEALIGAEILSVFPRAGVARLRALLGRFDADRGPATRAMTVGADARSLRATLTSAWRDGARQSLVLTLTEMAVRPDDPSQPARLLQYLAHEMRASLLIMDEHLRSLAAAPGGPGSGRPAAEAAGTIALLTQETGRLLRLLGDAGHLHQTMRELTAVELEPVDMVEVIKDGISGITALAVPQGVDVSYRGPSSAPRVSGDRDRLIQVLYNLLLNALRATPRGGTIRVELAAGSGEVATTVADSGHGIVPKDLREILVRARRPEMFLPGKGERVGLGLCIAHQIVRAHGGRMTADSVPGAGSRFGFALPVAPEAVAPAGAVE
jgi:signal transduction histidine kinase